MDLNKDARLTFDEFKEGSKQDPTIVQVSCVFQEATDRAHGRLCRCTTVWSRMSVHVSITSMLVCEKCTIGHREEKKALA